MILNQYINAVHHTGAKINKWINPWNFLLIDLQLAHRSLMQPACCYQPDNHTHFIMHVLCDATRTTEKICSVGGRPNLWTTTDTSKGWFSGGWKVSIVPSWMPSAAQPSDGGHLLVPLSSLPVSEYGNKKKIWYHEDENKKTAQSWASEVKVTALRSVFKHNEMI